MRLRVNERSVAERFYRLLLVLYPVAFRREYGAAMVCVFRERWVLEYARSRTLVGLRVWWLTIGDLLLSAYRERRAQWRDRRSQRPQQSPRQRSGAMRFLHGLLRDVRYTLRSFVRTPRFTVLAVVTIAVGIGVNAAIFSVIYGSLLRPLAYTEPDRLVWLSDGHENFGGAGVNQSIPNLMDLREGSRLMASSAIYTYARGSLSTSDRPERVLVLYTSSEMLRVLQVEPQLGRAFFPGDDVAGSESVAILTDGLWRTRFGADPGVIGQTTFIDAKPVRIVGVTPPDFEFPSEPALLSTLQHEGAEFSRDRRWYNAIGRLAPGADLQSLRQELQGIYGRLVEAYPEANSGWYTWAQPLREVALGRNRQSLFLLWGAVVLVLLIACLNVANLLVVRTEARHREFAVRYALGAGRSGLLPLFLSEGLIISLLGGALGILAAGWGIDLLIGLYGSSLQRAGSIQLSGTALAFGVGITVITGLSMALVPLLRVNPERLHDSLKEGDRGSSTRGGWVGRAMIVTEVALAVPIVIGAGLLLNSMWRLQSVELGVKHSERVLTFQISLPSATYEEPSTIAAFYDGTVRSLESVPGVEAVATVNRLPLLGGANSDLSVYGDPKRIARFVSIRSITSRYFEVTGVPLLSGRWFDRSEFLDGTTAILINQTLARLLFGSEDPLGQSLDRGENGSEIIGVVGDIMGGRPDQSAPPAIYFPAMHGASSDRSFLVKTAGDPRALISTIRAAVGRQDSQVPMFGIRTLRDIALDNLSTRRFAMSLFGVFAGLALLLGAVGIYGVTSFAVAQRSRELGVRLALGATPTSVTGFVLSQSARLTIPGLLIGLALALAFARVLSSLLYEVGALDPTTYVAVAALFMAVALVAAYVPARRASRLDPLISIRDE
jgi:putative ABC transport system permease protein